MGKIVDFGGGEGEDSSGCETLGDFLAETAVSDSGTIDSVAAVREIRERD